MKQKSYGPYERFFKRPIDIFCALFVIIVFSWLYIVFAILGAIFMKGNPFFVQERPGKDEKIFKLIKFRTMDNRKDKDGKLLPDAARINKYGKFLRSTSIDELPEFINILKGDMSMVGPRPLAVQYLPYYNEEEKLRHSVRPGLTGLAQINGRNVLNWPERFKWDITYVETISFKGDLVIIFKTVSKVIKRSDIVVRQTSSIIDFDKYRIQEMQANNNGENTDE